MSGLFIVFEGGDSAGKSTQAQLLDQWLAELCIERLLTFEPGDTWLGAQVRQLVLGLHNEQVCPRAESLLYAADKAQHLDQVVLPALARGAVVICDRYTDSTLAYQGAGRALDVPALAEMVRWATNGVRPDLTVLLDIDPGQGVETLASPDRLEAAGADLHQRARAYFLELAAERPEEYLVLPARDDRDAIAAAVRQRVEPLLLDRGLLLGGGQGEQEPR